METKRIIELGNVKELQVKTYFDHYRKVYGDDNLRIVQENTTKYAQNLAERFVMTNMEFFSQKENRTKIYRYIRGGLSADKSHSGHRFWEELNKKLVVLEGKTEGSDLESSIET